MAKPQASPRAVGCKDSGRKGAADIGLQPAAQPAADKQQLAGKGDRVPCDHSSKSD